MHCGLEGGWRLGPEILTGGFSLNKRDRRNLEGSLRQGHEKRDVQIAQQAQVIITTEHSVSTKQHIVHTIWQWSKSSKLASFQPFPANLGLRLWLMNGQACKPGL